MNHMCERIKYKGNFVDFEKSTSKLKDYDVHAQYSIKNSICHVCAYSFLFT